jgi:hypothetical protein
MKRTTLFWILAFLVTAISALYQRVTGPTYPVSGKVQVANVPLSYRLLRSQGGTEDAPVTIAVDDTSISGIVEWKRLNSDDTWNTLPMGRLGGVLEARLPHQPPAGKLVYRVVLMKGEQRVVLPPEGAAVLRYKGDVPTAILVIHVFAMFGAMFLSTRTGLEFFNPNPRFRSLIYWTIGFLAFGGLVMGPIVQKYAFDAYWTGWPFGTDLTDNKTFLGLLGWIAAAVALKRGRTPRVWALGASIFLFIIYLIPHSVLGSELDYRQMRQHQTGGTETNK